MQFDDDEDQGKSDKLFRKEAQSTLLRVKKEFVDRVKYEEMMEIKCQSFKTFDNLLETNQLYKKLKSKDPSKPSSHAPKRKQPKTEEQIAHEADDIANDFLRDLVDDFGIDVPGLPPKRENNSFVSNVTSRQS